MVSGCAGTLERGEALYRQGDVRGALAEWRAEESDSGEYERIQGRLRVVAAEFERMLRRYEKRAGFFASEERLALAALYYRLAYKMDPGREALLDRVQTLVRERVRIFERIAPFKRAGSLQRPRSSFLQERHAEMNRRLRADAAAALAPEFEAGPELLVDAIELLTCFEAWDRLRCDQRLGRDRARRVIEQSVHAVLSGYEAAESQID